MADTLGFRIYKCRDGWCFVRDDVGTVYHPVSRISAFSTLSQALWHLVQRVKKIEASDANVIQPQPARRIEPSAGGKEAGAKAQPPATGTGASENEDAADQPAAA